MTLPCNEKGRFILSIKHSTTIHGRAIREKICETTSVVQRFLERGMECHFDESQRCQFDERLQRHCDEGEHCHFDER